MTGWREFDPALGEVLVDLPDGAVLVLSGQGDRKSTRLNSSHW